MQEFLYINDLTFTYPTAIEPLFDDVTLQFQLGWTGIVGPNGGGKTTLLKLIHGDFMPDSGAIISPGHVCYAEQRMDERPTGLAHFFSSFDKNTIRIKNRLRIQDDWPDRWDSLSFGERKRCQVAVALAEVPAVLLLDEPSNHLDHFSKSILIAALRAYRGIGLLVSHDRELLDVLCSHTLFIEPPVVDLRACNYSTAATEREREQQTLAHDREMIRREMKKQKRRVQQLRLKADAADKQRSKRGIDRKDRDAKAKIDAARLTGKDATQGRLYQRAQSQLERTEARLADTRTKKHYTLGISYAEGASYKFPVTIPATALVMGETTLRIPELAVQQGEKIGLVGDNGAGKSTFVRHLMLSLPFRANELVYIPQEIPAAAAQSILADVQQLDNTDKGDMLTIIRRLGSEPARLLETTTPSPGEVRKLMLAQGLRKNPALIIMDEPTNHMDLPSIRCVEEALRECGKTLLLVSHDYVFLQNVVSYFWVFEREGKSNVIVPRYSL